MDLYGPVWPCRKKGKLGKICNTGKIGKIGKKGKLGNIIFKGENWKYEGYSANQSKWYVPKIGKVQKERK